MEFFDGKSCRTALPSYNIIKLVLFVISDDVLTALTFDFGKHV